MSAIGPLCTIAQFCILIWGSIIVFGKLNFYSVLLVGITINLLDMKLFGLSNINLSFLKLLNDIQFEGNYGEWVYDESKNGDDEYCGYTPFLFAFVMLILYWIAFPIILCCCCMVACAGCAGFLAMVGLDE